MLDQIKNNISNSISSKYILKRINLNHVFPDFGYEVIILNTKNKIKLYDELL